jgi:hypothetical protein
MLTVDIFPADEGGCGWYRLRFPARALADDPNLAIRIDPPLSAEGSESVLGRFPTRVHTDADVVVFQRPLRGELVRHIPVLQRHGVACVVEVDDDFHALPKGHPARKRLAPANSPHSNWRHLADACRQADLVTVSTPALAARYGSHGRVRVLRNRVPATYLDIDGASNERPTIGWPGLVNSHTGDLEMLGPAIAFAMLDTGAAFRAIGSQLTLDTLGVSGEVVPWAPLTDLGPHGYPAAVAGLDVGIVPLVDSPFAAAKSALKGMEMAALGVPFVASPLPEYRRLYEQGAGMLASSRDEWRVKVGALAGSAEMRADYAGRGRAVMTDLTYERHCGEWADAWTEAAAIRRGEKAA